MQLSVEIEFFRIDPSGKQAIQDRRPDGFNLAVHYQRIIEIHHLEFWPRSDPGHFSAAGIPLCTLQNKEQNKLWSGSRAMGSVKTKTK